MEERQLEELKHKTPVIIKNCTGDSDNMEIIFDDGTKINFYHSQDCCEVVEIYDVIGDISDLIGNPLTMCEEVSSPDEPKDVDKYYDDSHTWTFYKFATIKGYVTIRWLGQSNGYYSEAVNYQILAPTDSIK